MEQLSLSILGASSAIPLSNRSPSAQFLGIGNEFFLIDCGEGTQVKLRQHRIGFGRIKHILISHLHGDHFYGLIPLLTTLQLLDRHAALHIYGPEKLEELVRHQLELTESKISYPLHFHALDPDRKTCIFENKHLEVHSFPLRHGITCFGFLFQEKPLPRKMLKEELEKYDIPVAEIRRIKAGSDWIDANGKRIPNEELTEASAAPMSYAYCTDTLPVKHLHRYFKGVDLLYHEATFLSSEKDRALQTNHSTAAQAAEIAEICKAEQLLIGHFSVRYKDFHGLLAEAQSVFPKTLIAGEGLHFSLDRKSRELKIERENSYRG
ncbi:ribonuclease Z [Croceimicrobium sp.]|uniref:ribonuclease Z n=1 Tax=Croceimicrobium sp. TaxID=2828340 RepID=UPI003BAD92EE